MFDETTMNPAELSALVESAPKKRGRKASISSQPKAGPPSAQITQDAATIKPQTNAAEPRPEWSSGHVALGPYDTAPVAETISEIVQLHRLRQGMIKAQTKLVLQAMASVRYMVHEDGDYDSDEAKAKARKRAEDLYRTIRDNPSHEYYTNIIPYLLAGEPLEKQRSLYEKQMVKAAKRLPIYPWVASVKGLGDISFATIIGECGDIGTYKSVSAVWKRLGLAVIGGLRQGNPGAGATADDWILHGYNKQRRSVSWNARNQLIGGMGLWRPVFGSDLSDANYYQRVFAERARFESEKLGLPVTESASGKESYKKHATNRAMRYVEKRMLRNLYIEWRRH